MSTSTPTTSFLATKASDLVSQTPVPPSQARTAQIPLQTFNLPTFPAEAFSAGLTSLILTSDIKLDDYQSLLAQPFSVPDLPSTITSLTLELFSLGYPPGFLTEVGQRLPGLKSLTLYSQLLAGTTPHSRDDALTFFRLQTQLAEIHLLDVFAGDGFYAKLAATVGPALRFLEINFTYRHSDPDFLKSVPSKELVAFLRGGLLGLTASISSPDVTEDEDDREGTEVGILPVDIKDSGKLVERLRSVGGEMVMLDLTMFNLDLEAVGILVGACPKVKILGITVGVEKGWGELFEALGKGGRGRGIEVLEVVAVPGVAFVERIKQGETAGLSQDVLVATGAAGCEGLKSVQVSILRTHAEQWVREGDEWALEA
ncbi:hypothetical protein QTJ16_006461 [Diplocarpon rosae]|uniref:Uncharacterized protein n=1 Tax=Diplocarpon rosae TaxID=946125 RepID=A0AAD9WCM0_9HELO|nr:hypothetical protein QTJ16_006461 [Diplocarpon rosae]